MKSLTKILIVANLLALLGYLLWSVRQSEDLLENGQLVLLELAPADPRSLMQGDYMRLDYAINRREADDSRVDWPTVPKRGYVVVALDDLGVGRRLRLQTEREPLAEGEILLPYVKKEWRLNIGAGSYFFQEGRAADFARAEYGGLRVDEGGNSLLVGLYDDRRQLIE